MKNPDLRITDAIAYPLRAKLPNAQRTSQGDWPSLDIAVVEIRTDAGIVGWGECLARTSSPAYAAVVETLLKPVLVGRNPFDAAALWRAMRGRLTGRAGGMLVESIAGIDIALWDIMGKAAGLPVHRLLGGVGRREILAYASSINWADDARAEGETRDCLARGFGAIKVKIGLDLDEDLERLARLRELVGGRARLTIDANQGFRPADLPRLFRALDELDIDFLEQPLPPALDDECLRLAARDRARLALDESLLSIADARAHAAAGRAGIYNIKLMKCGGPSPALEIARVAHDHGVALMWGCSDESRIGIAAALHVALAAPATRFLDLDGHLDLARDRGRGGFEIVDGLMYPSGAPGLGVDVEAWS